MSNSGYVEIAPVTWDVVDVNRKVEALNGDWTGVDPLSIYPQGAYLLLTNKVLKSCWKFEVKATLHYRRGVEDYIQVCELEYKINEPMTFKEAAAILTGDLGIDLSFTFHKYPQEVLITGSGFVKVENNGTNRNRRKVKPRR